MGYPVHCRNMIAKRPATDETPVKRFQTFVPADGTSDFHL